MFRITTLAALAAFCLLTSVAFAAENDPGTTIIIDLNQPDQTALAQLSERVRMAAEHNAIVAVSKRRVVGERKACLIWADGTHVMQIQCMPSAEADEELKKESQYAVFVVYNSSSLYGTLRKLMQQDDAAEIADEIGLIDQIRSVSSVFASRWP